jgi:hypothetical protein
MTETFHIQVPRQSSYFESKKKCDEPKLGIDGLHHILQLLLSMVKSYFLVNQYELY